jgi:hypothetical protein
MLDTALQLTPACCGYRDAVEVAVLMQIAASQSGPAGPDSRFFNRVNDYRGVGTRYKKLVANFCHGQTRRRACVAQGTPTTFRANEIYSEPRSIMWARSRSAQKEKQSAARECQDLPCEMSNCRTGLR